MQADAEAAVADGLVGAAAGFDASLVAMDPRTGFVRAMVDSRPFAESTFNLAVDGARRAGGLELQGRDAVHDPRQRLLAQRLRRRHVAVQRAPVRRLRPRTPKGVGGIQTVREATTGSVNCAFVRMSTSVGLDKVADMATKLGMRPNVDGRQPYDEWSRVLTLTLGVISVTPVEMATIASTIAAGGERRDPVYVWKVEDAEGHVIFDESNRPGERVLEPDIAACVADVLHGPLGPGGTAAGSRPGARTPFGKTGTNDEKVTSAFIGATPELAAFVWHGDAEFPNDPPSGGQAGFGGDRPAHIWNAFMNRRAREHRRVDVRHARPEVQRARPVHRAAGRPHRPARTARSQQPLDPTTPSTLPGGILPRDHDPAAPAAADLGAADQPPHPERPEHSPGGTTDRRPVRRSGPRAAARPPGARPRARPAAPPARARCPSATRSPRSSPSSTASSASADRRRTGAGRDGARGAAARRRGDLARGEGGRGGAPALLGRGLVAARAAGDAGRRRAAAPAPVAAWRTGSSRSMERREALDEASSPTCRHAPAQLDTRGRRAPHDARRRRGRRSTARSRPRLAARSAIATRARRRRSSRSTSGGARRRGASARPGSSAPAARGATSRSRRSRPSASARRRRATIAYLRQLRLHPGPVSETGERADESSSTATVGRGGTRARPRSARWCSTRRPTRRRSLATVSECIGVTTNNVAEYQALIAGLEGGARVRRPPGRAARRLAAA